MNSIELPIVLVDRTLEELGVKLNKSHEEKSFITINVNCIESFRHGSPEGEDDLKCTQVIMQSGYEFLAYISYDEFKIKLNGNNNT